MGSLKPVASVEVPKDVKESKTVERVGWELSKERTCPALESGGVREIVSTTLFDLCPKREPRILSAPLDRRSMISVSLHPARNFSLPVVQATCSSDLGTLFIRQEIQRSSQNGKLRRGTAM